MMKFSRKRQESCEVKSCSKNDSQIIEKLFLKKYDYNNF